MKISRVLFLVLSLLIAGCSVAQEQKLTAEDIVARHLESIGTPQARAGVKSRTAQAAVLMDVLVGTTAHSEGKAMLVSLGRQASIQIRMQDGQFPDENFVFDGKDVKIGQIGPNARSRMGDWLYREDALMRESLFGGSLLTSWALLDIRSRQAKLKYDGLKKVDGRNLHDLIYLPKKGADNDLAIHLYFEPETFRHVKTVYTFLVPLPLAHMREQVRGTVRSQAQDRSDTRYRVEETFSEFRTVDGITLPGRWRVEYTVQSDKTLSTACEFAIGAVAHNNVVD